MNEQNITTIEENEERDAMTECYEDDNSGLVWKVIGGVLATAGVVLGGMKLKKIIKNKRDKKKYAECDTEVAEETKENISENEVEHVEVEVKEEKKTTKKK